MSVDRRRQSARTLLVLAGALMLAGAAAMSPAAASFCCVVAGLAALGALPRARIVAVVLPGLAVSAYPQYRAERQRMR